jgi:hypothetical protein
MDRIYQGSSVVLATIKSSKFQRGRRTHKISWIQSGGGRRRRENVLEQDEREDWTEDPMDGAEGQAWLEPDELGGRVRRISPEADDYGKTPNDVQQ